MSDTKTLIEAALFIAGRQVKYSELAEVAGSSKEEIQGRIEQISNEYSQRDSAITVTFDSKQALMHLRPEVEDEVMFMAPQTEMSQAMLKTLAVIAHGEPVTQTSLVKSRGTRAYYYIKKLSDMELVSARKHGRTKLLSTTQKFKEYFRLEKIPNIREDNQSG
ncbi:MAG: SMC-Scp complex subunit ScpB [Methanobacteriota archaeon]